MECGCPCPPIRNDIMTPRHLFIYSFSILQCALTFAVDNLRLWWCRCLQSRKTTCHLQPTACTSPKIKFWWCHRWHNQRCHQWCHQRCHNRLDWWIFTSSRQRWWRRLDWSRGYLLPSRWFHERQRRGVSSLDLKHNLSVCLLICHLNSSSAKNIRIPHPLSHYYNIITQCHFFFFITCSGTTCPSSTSKIILRTINRFTTTTTRTRTKIVSFAQLMSTLWMALMKPIG